MDKWLLIILFICWSLFKKILFFSTATEHFWWYAWGLVIMQIIFCLWQEIGCDLAPLQFLKRWKSLTQMTTLPTTDYSGGGTKTVSMFSKLMQQSSSFVMEGVKNLVVKKHNLPVTKIVDELMEIKQGQFNEEYLYFHPKILRGQDNIPRAKNPFQVRKRLKMFDNRWRWIFAFETLILVRWVASLWNLLLYHFSSHYLIALILSIILNNITAILVYV